MMANLASQMGANRRPRSDLLRVVGLLATLLMVAVSLALTASPVEAQGDGSISSDGVGAALVGSSANQLRSQLGPDWTVQLADPFLVDVEGYDVLFDGDVEFNAGRSVDVDTLSDNTPLTLFVVSDPGRTTVEGIGVDSTIGDAVAVYGAATVFTSEIEGRQFASFENGPDNINFRTTMGGVYPDGAELGEAPTVNEDGVIVEIWITCRPADGDCPDIPSLPDTGIGVSGIVAISLALMVVGVAMRLADKHMRRRNRRRPDWVAEW